MKSASQTVTMTKKGQVHIPTSMRKQLAIDAPTQFTIHVEGEKIVLQPKKSKILEFAGFLKDKKPARPVNIDKIRDYIDYSDL